MQLINVGTPDECGAGFACACVRTYYDVLVALTWRPLTCTVALYLV